MVPERGLFDARAALGLLALHQAHHSDDFESEFSGCFNRLDGRAPVVQTSSTITTLRPFFAESFNASDRFRAASLPCGREIRDLPLVTETATTIGSAPIVRPPMACGFQPRCTNLFEKYLAGQLRSSRIQRGGAAVDVIVARATGGELELAQLERLGSEEAQQFVAGR